MSLYVRRADRTQRSDVAMPTPLDQLLDPRRWRRDARDPELMKALGLLQARVAEARNFLELPSSRAPLRTPAVLEELRALLDVDPGSLDARAAWELANDLKQKLLLLGDADFVRTQLEYEATRDKLEDGRQRWSDQFSSEKLQELLGSLSEGSERDVLADAVSHLAELCRVRSEEALRRRTAIVRNTRYLTAATVSVGVVLLGVLIGTVSVRQNLWETALVAVLIGLVAGLIIGLSTARDHIVDLASLELFWPTIRLAIVGSVAFSTGFVAAHVAAVGMSGRSGTTELLLVCIGALVLTCLAVAWSGFWRRWTFWRQNDASDVGGGLLPTAVAVAALIELFAIVTVALAIYGWVDFLGEGEPKLGSLEQYYAWHLADAVPALDVPKTLNWEQPLASSDHLAGALLLAFKLLAILPVAALIAHLLERRKMGKEPS